MLYGLGAFGLFARIVFSYLGKERGACLQIVRLFVVLFLHRCEAHASDGDQLCMFCELAALDGRFDFASKKVFLSL